MPPNRIMFIRHAEKPNGTDAGVAPNGTADDENLIVLGWQRAGALARFFYPASGASGLLPPTTIFASGIGHGSKSERPMETVKPLVNLLKATSTVEFVTTHLKNDVEPLMKDVATRTATVLIAWEHHLIPSLVAALPNSPVVPKMWPDNRFDMVWVLDRTDTGWSFSQVPQLLLAGDSASPIT